MSFLLNTVNKVNDTFAKAGSFNSEFGMMTGMTPIDILSCNFERSFLHDETILNGGLFNFPYTELGLSASGKTTLWLQLVGAAIDNWCKLYGPVSEMIFYNVEGHTTTKRIQDVTGWDDWQLQERCRIISKPWSIIEIYNDLAVLARNKIAHRKELEINTGMRSITGDTIKVLPTTYALIDSIAAVRSKTDLEFDKEGNVKSTDTIAGTSNMDAMQIAKDNTMFINEVKKLCEEAKICLVMVNHLVEIPVLDRYNPPKPQLPGMKYNQKVKGGTELLYQSFCVGQLSVKERLFNEKTKIFGDAVHGIIAFMDWLKNKNGPEGVRYPMVFDSATGYKPELTDFEILYEEGQWGISGNPMGMYLDILPEIKFTRKTLMDLCHKDPILARALSFTTRLYLISKVLLHQLPPDIKALGELDFETRIYLILHYSMDYPGYENHGWIVDSEYFEIHDMVANGFERVDRYTNTLGNDEIIMLTEFDEPYIDNKVEISVYSNNEIKIGETEYIYGDNW